MTEKLLQFIWKNRHFNQQELRLFTGESLIVDFPGETNFDQGPDFIHARIRINGNHWTGSVELHLFSSGWEKHNHTRDENYRNVMLHVVWKHDQEENRLNIPLLELNHRVSRIMLDTYTGWMQKARFIPCESSAVKTGCDVWESWASRILQMRLNRKMQRIIGSLEENQYHWEQQLWWMIAACFGNAVNSAAFESVARSIPFALLSKHRPNVMQLEALFMGQANLLEKDCADEYFSTLKSEFDFLRNKYKLKPIYQPVHFLRMRPENFPTVRLSQLAALHAAGTLSFSYLLDCDSVTEIRKRLTVQASAYWNHHYVFGKASLFREKIHGTGSCDRIIINAIIPLLYTYGKLTPESAVVKKVNRWLDILPAEDNHLIDGWRKVGIHVTKAGSTQALTELKKEFCDLRKCLECDIGKHLLKQRVLYQ